jgi:hypothetical protein
MNNYLCEDLGHVRIIDFITGFLDAVPAEKLSIRRSGRMQHAVSFLTCLLFNEIVFVVLCTHFCKTYRLAAIITGRFVSKGHKTKYEDSRWEYPGDSRVPTRDRGIA